MKIGINVAWLASGKAGGTEDYIRNLLFQLAQIDKKNEYYLLTSTYNFRSFNIPNHRWKKIVYSGVETFPSSLVSLPRNGSEEESFSEKVKSVVRLLRAFPNSYVRKNLAETIKSLGLDLWFCPLVYTLPVGLNIPVVNTIPDIQHEIFPENFDKEELTHRMLGFQYSCKMAAATLTISSSSMKQLISKYFLSPERVFLTPPGLDLQFLSDPNQIEELAKKVKLKYGLERPYIYYPSYGWKHKNHENLVRAFALVLEQGHDLDLLFTGTEFNLLERIDRVITEHKLEGRVRHLGYVDKAEVVGLFSLSKIIAFPSLFEGFGLPVLEALHMGIPVACSRLASLEEIAEEAAIYFDPSSPPEIATSLIRLLTDMDLRNSLIVNGKQRAEGFSYRRTAEETLKVFEKIGRGELPSSALPPFRPLLPNGWIRDGHCRWYFRAEDLSEIELELARPTDTRYPRDLEITAILNGTEVTKAEIKQEARLVLTQKPTTTGDVDFHRLELFTTDPSSNKGSASLQVRKFIIHYSNGKTLQIA